MNELDCSNADGWLVYLCENKRLSLAGWVKPYCCNMMRTSVLKVGKVETTDAVKHERREQELNPSQNGKLSMNNLQLKGRGYQHFTLSAVFTTAVPTKLMSPKGLSRTTSRPNADGSLVQAAWGTSPACDGMQHRPQFRRTEVGHTGPETPEPEPRPSVHFQSISSTQLEFTLAIHQNLADDQQNVRQKHLQPMMPSGIQPADALHDAHVPST